jgi:hypothetical protein
VRHPSTHYLYVVVTSANNLLATTPTQSQSQADVSAQRRVIRGLLLIDARRMIEASAYLENLLKGQRMKTWLIHGLM